MSLTSKCVFYRLEHKASGDPWNEIFETLEMQWWDKPTDRVSESINKRTFMKKIVSDSVNCISKKLWKIASADVKQ